jgi:gas vesicle protein
MTQDVATDHRATDHVATDRVAMNTSKPNAPRPGFTVGLIMGGIVGAAVALAFAPRAGADLRRSVAGSARNLGTGATDRYHDATARVGRAVDHLADKVRAVPDDVAGAVASGAHEVARFATSMKS